MSDIAIRTERLTKIYKLYGKPHHRILDMMGMLGKRRHSEHIALENIDLDVRRGEKVAIIGRNGAGKSTLLKLITKVIYPTSGRVEANGRVNALLQIGAGFHPDFTARENIRAYLAQLGATRKEADRRVPEIIGFAELEEYVDQPVKTFSTGMAARLMFAAATAFTPEILVLDEILSVGDAYFSRKCFERMEEMTSRSGTTLLLVTHDVYSAIRICDRIIWIDRGRIVMDGAGRAVANAYEDSIRQQEEARLRLKKIATLKQANSRPQGVPTFQMLVEIRAVDNRPQPCIVSFGEISLLSDGRVVSSLPLGPDVGSDEAASHLVRETGNWGEMAVLGERTVRPMLNYGSPYQKVSGVFRCFDPSGAISSSSLRLRIEYLSEQPCELQVLAFAEGAEQTLGLMPPSNGNWVTHTVDLGLRDDQAAATIDTGAAPSVSTSGVHGTGTISILDVRMFNELREETHILKHGKPAELLVSYRINKPGFNEKVQMLVAIHRDGTQLVCRIIARDMVLDSTAAVSGVVSISLRRMALGEGTYSISVLIVEEGYFDKEQVLFFSINPAVHACTTRLFEFKVVEGGLVGTGTVFVDEAEWQVMPHRCAGANIG